MIDLNQCSNIGYTAKTHGVNGQLIIRLKNISSDSIKELEWVFLIFEGLPVPFLVEDWTERPPDSFLVNIDDVTTIEQAQKLIQKEVFVPDSVISVQKDLTLSFKSYMGYAIIDKAKGLIGELIDVLDFQDNPIMSVKQGAKEIMIPIHNDFITSIDAKNRTINVVLPEGLIDL